MQSLADDVEIEPPTVGLIGKIPVRNVWLLFLYASGLAQYRGKFDAEVEASPDFNSLVARLLCVATEKRLRRNLSYGYHHREETLHRVRGRIDLLKTESRDLLRRGEIACRFEELTINTPRNRLVRAALAALPGWVEDGDLAHRCRTLASMLGRVGVTGEKPSRTEMIVDQIARHEADDRLMVSLAHAVFDLILPTEVAGSRALLEAGREEKAFRTLFEKAIGNFFDIELSRSDGWRVYPGKKYKWPVSAGSPGIAAYLPEMITDIILENVQEQRRIIIDTKFTNVLTRSQFGSSRFKTGHLYQLFAYLSSQESAEDPLSLSAEGMLLYPAVGLSVDETALIQGHRLRFATVDLSISSEDVITQLKQVPLVSQLFRAPY